MEQRRFHNYLRRFRREKGFTQKDVAKALGLKNSAVISRWEKGLRLPDTLNALKLAALFRSSVDVIYQDLRFAIADEIHKRMNTTRMAGMEEND